MDSSERLKSKKGGEDSPQAPKFYDAPERKRVKSEVRERKFGNRITRGIKAASYELKQAGKDAKEAEKTVREVQKSLKRVMNKRNSFLIKFFNKKEYNRLGIEEAKIIAQEKQANEDALAVLEKKRLASEEMIRLSKLKEAIQKLKKGETIQDSKKPAEEILAVVERGLPELTWKEQKELEKKRKKRDNIPPVVQQVQAKQGPSKFFREIKEVPSSLESQMTLAEATKSLELAIAEYKHPKDRVSNSEHTAHEVLSHAFENYLEALSREAPAEYALQRQTVYEMLHELTATRRIINEESLFKEEVIRQEKAFAAEAARQARDPKIKKKKRAARQKAWLVAGALLGFETLAGWYTLDQTGEPSEVSRVDEEMGSKTTMTPSLGEDVDKIHSVPFSDVAAESPREVSFRDESLPEEYLPSLHSEETERQEEVLGGPATNEQN